MAPIISWRIAKPRTMFGGKGVLIPYGKKQTQKETESQPPSAESQSVSTVAPSASVLPSREERNRAFAKAILENLNRNTIESEASKNKFGCEDCWPEDPEAAWKARYGLSRVAELIDESHFHVMVLACTKCGQRFVSVFTEIVDWKDGEDPQFWTLLPITEAEAEMLIRKGDTVTEQELNKLGPGRRSLLHDNPKGGPQKFNWGKGIWVGMHD